MPDVIADPEGWPTGDGDAVVEFADTTGAPGEDAEESASCGCCGGNNCTYLPCTTWPPSQFDVTLSGLTAPDPCCNDVYIGFSLTIEYSYSVAYPENCVNNTFPVALVPTRHDFVHPCRWDYRWTCDIAIFDDPHWRMSIEAVIFADLDGITITAIISVQPRYFLHTPNTWVCGFLRFYKVEYATEDFPCSGPWVLDLDPENEPFNQNNGWTGLPNTITFNPSFGSEPPSADFDDCCDLDVTYCPAFDCDASLCVQVTSGTGTYDTITDCMGAPCGTDHSWNCVDGVCVDVGVGGTYPSFDSCQEACVVAPTATYNCVSGVCVDPGDSSGFYTGATAYDDCFIACSPGGSDTRPLCCGGTTTGPDQLIAIIGSEEPCLCFVQSMTVVWSPGVNAYVASIPDVCGRAIQGLVYCLPTEGGSGQWYFELICDGDDPDDPVQTVVVIALAPVGGGDSTWDGSGTSVPTSCCATPVTISVLITPVGDPATQPGLCEGGGGGA